MKRTVLASGAAVSVAALGLIGLRELARARSCQLFGTLVDRAETSERVAALHQGAKTRRREGPEGLRPTRRWPARAIVPPDYVLLEHGQLMGVADDLANMTSRPAGFERTDAFDFRLVTIEGTLAA